MSEINLNFKRNTRSTINLQINAGGSKNPARNTNTAGEERPIKRSRQVTVLPDEKDKILDGFEKSVATIIKHHAHSVYKNQLYHKLNDTEKNSLSNGFNSILDLTDNDSNSSSQRSLFTSNQWVELNRLWNKQKKWSTIDKEIQKKMKKIESLAMTDIKAAYCECLDSQTTYAMTEDRGYFEAYAFLLKILKEKPNILNSASKEKFAEGDYVVTLWSRIFSIIFEDRSQNLCCKWTDTVPEGSSAEKRSSQDAGSNAIGDKIDLRVCTTSPSGRIVDLLSVEFAKQNNSSKFFADHRKVLREAKVNADQFYRSKYLSSRDKRNVRGHCMQIAGTEGQMSEVKLVDNGLYVASHLGSLRLPSSQMDLRNLRTLLERLFTIKKIIVSQKAYYDMIEHSECAAIKSMESKQNTERSPYSPSHQSSPSSPSSPSLFPSESSNEAYTTWVRDTWFSPSKKKDCKYEGEWSPSLFSPLQ